jgi:hypothetical protein
MAPPEVAPNSQAAHERGRSTPTISGSTSESGTSNRQTFDQHPLCSPRRRPITAPPPSPRCIFKLQTSAACESSKTPAAPFQISICSLHDRLVRHRARLDIPARHSRRDHLVWPAPDSPVAISKAGHQIGDCSLVEASLSGAASPSLPY